jgi:hypothetical protein
VNIKFEWRYILKTLVAPPLLSTHDGGRTTTTDDNKRQRTNYDDDTTDESNLKNPNPNHQKVSAFLGPRDATVIKPFQLASASEELVRN